MNNIKEYEHFLFEAESTETQISSVRMEISKLKDQIKEAKTKMTEDEKASQNEAQKINAEVKFIEIESQVYGKMIPLLNNLKTKLTQKASEIN